MKIVRSAAVLPLLFLLACGSSSKSSPTASQSQLAVAMLLDTFSTGSLLAASVSLDGQEIGRSDWSNIGGCIGTCLIQGAQGTFPAPGPHTVTVTILNETPSLIDYNVSGTVFLTTSTIDGTIPLALQTLKLPVGGTAKYSITI